MLASWPELSSRTSSATSKHSRTTYWPLFLLRYQISLMYFYAGYAKIHADFLAGEVLRMYMHMPFGIPAYYFATVTSNDAVSTAPPCFICTNSRYAPGSGKP